MSEVKKRGRKRKENCKKPSKSNIKKYFSSTLRSKIDTFQESTSILCINVNEDDNELQYSDNVTERAENSKVADHSVLGDFIETWKQSTTICCWNCVHPFETTPVGVPVHFRNGKFILKGIFCGFPCMIRYAIDRCLYDTVKHHIVHMFKVLTGYSSDDMKPAPFTCCLKIFGGKLELDEYRKANQVKMYKYIKYPMHISRDYIEELDLQNIKEVNDYVFKKTSNTSNKPNILDFLN